MEPKKALVIDDSSLIHKVFRLLLPQTVLVDAFDGGEALERIAEHPDVDLILLDINMPTMNGFELLERLKADAALASIPVIIVSTEGKDEDTLRGLRAGATAYLRKPFRNEAVKELVRQVMERASRRPQPV
ncbi:MAG TPA: response regulator [Thermoanaerobaculia bacterium]|nr:response regulator [Thermoanaerobaculia bacterium]